MTYIVLFSWVRKYENFLRTVDNPNLFTLFFSLNISMNVKQSFKQDSTYVRKHLKNTSLENSDSRRELVLS